MRYMNAKRKKFTIDLQLFAREGTDGDDGDNAGGDDQDGGTPDKDVVEPEEKKYSEKDMEAAIEKRLARERRKWKREQMKSGDDDKPVAGDEGFDASKARQAEEKVSKMEMKIACFEADVDKNSVDDVAALARAYMEANDKLDLEDAIEKVVKKYPHFKKSSEPNASKSWGERHKGSGSKLSGVEAAFLKKNPGLKID